MYDETTNEWQIITGVEETICYESNYMHIPLGVDGELYLVDLKEFNPGRGRCSKQMRIKRYYPEENKWQTKTKVTASDSTPYSQPTIVCSMRIFKGIFKMRQVEAIPFDDERKCLIM